MTQFPTHIDMRLANTPSYDIHITIETKGGEWFMAYGAGYGGGGGCCYTGGGYGAGFALIVVLFILLIIVGTAYVY